MQIPLEQCRSGKFHVFANFCPKVDKLAGGDHFGPDIICAQAKRPHTALHRNIPDICHEPHEHVRVNFFWPV